MKFDDLNYISNKPTYFFLISKAISKFFYLSHFQSVDLFFSNIK